MKKSELLARKEALELQLKKAKERSAEAAAKEAVHARRTQEAKRAQDDTERMVEANRQHRQVQVRESERVLDTERKREASTRASLAKTSSDVEKCRSSAKAKRERAEQAKLQLDRARNSRIQQVTVEMEYYRDANARSNKQYLDGSVLLIKADQNADGDLYSFVDYLSKNTGLPPGEAKLRSSRQVAPGLKHSGDMWFDERGKRQQDAETAVRCKQRISVDLCSVARGWS